MKIAVTASSDKGIEANVDSRFGRARYFAIVDVETMEVNFVENSASKAASGAGISAAQAVSEQGVDAVISGNFGPKAFSGLQAAQLKLYSIDGGTIKDAVEKLKEGALQELSDPTNNAHAGLR